jgi:hypothetical protein
MQQQTPSFYYSLMKNPNLINFENIKNLSLEAMGLLLFHAYGLDRDDVSSSNVTFESALDELKLKERVKMVTQKEDCSCH